MDFVGRLTDAEMIDHLARCRAVVFAPWNEDYGFVTVEAFMCGKPVLTVSDSGGPSELVEGRRVSGYVTDPTPEALAVALREVMSDRTRAIRMGEAGAVQAANDDLARRGRDAAEIMAPRIINQPIKPSNHQIDHQIRSKDHDIRRSITRSTHQEITRFAIPHHFTLTTMCAVVQQH